MQHRDTHMESDSTRVFIDIPFTQPWAQSDAPCGVSASYTHGSYS